MADAIKNFAKVEVSTGYAAGAVTVVLQAGEGAKLPDPVGDGEFNLVWWDSTNYADPADDPLVEIVRCTARSTDTLTVTRAQEGTADTNKNTGGATYKMILAPTKKTIDDIMSDITTLEGDVTEIDEVAKAVEFPVNQSTHGFLVTNSIRYDFGTTSWVKAIANSDSNLGTHIVTEVVDGNNFKCSAVGRYTITGHGLTPGQYYFTSSTTPGALTNTEPELSNPMIYVESANVVHILPFRPSYSGEAAVASNVSRDIWAEWNLFQMDKINLVMTGGGRYLLKPENSPSNVWEVWDTFGENLYSYYREPETTESTSIYPLICTRVMDGNTERVIAFADGGTSGYRYNYDGSNETVVTVSGTTLNGVRRIGYDNNSGMVYIQDGAGYDSTTIMRFTFSGSTLTYVDSITLSAAPSINNPSCHLIFVGSTYLAFEDGVTNNSRVTFKRYNKTTGSATTDRNYGNGTVGVGFVGLCVRESDDGFIFWQESSGDSAAFSIGQRINERLDT